MKIDQLRKGLYDLGLPVQEIEYDVDRERIFVTLSFDTKWTLSKEDKVRLEPMGEEEFCNELPKCELVDAESDSDKHRIKILQVQLKILESKDLEEAKSLFEQYLELIRSPARFL